jgi:glutathione-independent formaldehyde dehydrogenase
VGAHVGPHQHRQVVGVQVISLDQAPEGYGEFDAGAPKKFVIDPHKLCSAA